MTQLASNAARPVTFFVARNPTARLAAIVALDRGRSRDPDRGTFAAS
jgi:hypothetical protein